MLPTEHRVQNPASLKRGLGAALVSWAVVLIFTLFAHVITCAPCYDDDVCASARIDGNILQAIDVQTVDVGNSSDGGNTKVIVQPTLELAAVLNSTDLSRAVSAYYASPNREIWHRNSSLAHRQTVVLVI